MGAKKKKNDDEGEKKGGDGGGGGGGGGGKKEAENPNAVVFKVDMHCEGCANKIIRCVKGFEGVESVKAESEANKLTVVGKVDPLKLRDKLATKTKKKVELISPIPKKEKESKPKPDDNKPDEKKKPKEVPLTMAVLKVGFHCQGCIEKIHKLISKTKGVQEMSMDKEKEQVTVKGTMDVKALCESLKERLKRPVEVVPPKKEKEKEKEKGKEKEAGEKKDGGNGGGGKTTKGGGGGGEKAEEGVGKMEGNRMEVMRVPGYGYGYGYGLMQGYEYGYGGGEHIHHYHDAPPQTFSDENPNACSIM